MLNLPERGWQEFHVGDYEEEHVSPEDKADRAISVSVADEIEEDNIGNDDGCQEKKRRNFTRWERMLPRKRVISLQNLPNKEGLSERQVHEVNGPRRRQNKWD